MKNSSEKDVYLEVKKLGEEIDKMNIELGKKYREIQNLLQCDWRYESMTSEAERILAGSLEKPGIGYASFSSKAAEQIVKIINQRGYEVKVSDPCFDSYYKLNLVSLKVKIPGRKETPCLSQSNFFTPTTCLEDFFD